MTRHNEGPAEWAVIQDRPGVNCRPAENLKELLLAQRFQKVFAIKKLRATVRPVECVQNSEKSISDSLPLNACIPCCSAAGLAEFTLAAGSCFRLATKNKMLSVSFCLFLNDFSNNLLAGRAGVVHSVHKHQSESPRAHTKLHCDRPTNRISFHGKATALGTRVKFHYRRTKATTRPFASKFTGYTETDTHCTLAFR